MSRGLIANYQLITNNFWPLKLKELTIKWCNRGKMLKIKIPFAVNSNCNSLKIRRNLRGPCHLIRDDSNENEPIYTSTVIFTLSSCQSSYLMWNPISTFVMSPYNYTAIPGLHLQKEQATCQFKERKILGRDTPSIHSSIHPSIPDKQTMKSTPDSSMKLKMTTSCIVVHH